MIEHIFNGGRYTVINDNDKVTILRDGEPWVSNVLLSAAYFDGNLLHAMLVEVDTLKQRRDELLAELQKAHQIILNALPQMNTAEKSAWGARNERDGVAGEGITRYHEREALINRIKESKS